MFPWEEFNFRFPSKPEHDPWLHQSGIAHIIPLLPGIIETLLKQ